MLTRERWTRGIGSDCNHVYDKDSHLVATTIRPDDGTAIVNAVNENAMLRARITHLETALQRSSDDNLEYLTCQPGCNSYGHDEQCAVANPRMEFDRLRAENERLKELQAKNEGRVKEIVDEHLTRQVDDLRTQVEALTRLWDAITKIMFQALEQEKQAHNKAHASQARVVALEEALEHIAEYWNGNENERAMADACHMAIKTAQQALSKEGA